MSTFRSIRTLSVGLGVAVATGILGAANPAAAVPGLVTAQGSSVSDSTAEKVVAVACPTGTRAIGGSAVVGGSTRVRINSAVPDPTRYTVLAREPRGGEPGNWFVVVTAHCAPVSALPGLEYRRTASVFDSTFNHAVTATCSPGKKLIGVGGLIDSNGPGQDKLVLTAVRPSSDLGSVRVDGSEDEGGYTGGWRTTAVGVCINPAAGLRLATSPSSVSSVSFKSVVAVCPPGTRIHSGGFDAGLGRGQVNLTSSFLDYDVASDSTRQGFEAQAREDQSGFPSTWRLSAYAICAN